MSLQILLSLWGKEISAMSHSERRWYDTDPSTSHFVKTIQVFPEPVQAVICKALINLADLKFKAGERLLNYKSMGKNKLLSMYASKNRRRAYDQSPMTHRIMHYGQFLAPSEKDYLIEKANGVVSMTTDYLGHCKTFQEPPTLQVIGELADEYLDKGESAAQDYLKQIQGTFEGKQDKPEKSPMQRFEVIEIIGDKIQST